jgi:hypothetical protein
MLKYAYLVKLRRAPGYSFPVALTAARVDAFTDKTLVARYPALTTGVWCDYVVATAKKDPPVNSTPAKKEEDNQWSF